MGNTRLENLLNQIKNQIEYHLEQEGYNYQNKNYNEASYHSARRSALEDILIWHTHLNKETKL